MQDGLLLHFTITVVGKSIKQVVFDVASSPTCAVVGNVKCHGSQRGGTQTQEPACPYNAGERSKNQTYRMLSQTTREEWCNIPYFLFPILISGATDARL